MKTSLLLLVACFAAGTAQVQAQVQTPDPISTAVGQEWQASEVERGHLAEALQKLIQAYAAAQEKQKVVDAYWKDYVVGLSREPSVSEK